MMLLQPSDCHLSSRHAKIAHTFSSKTGIRFLKADTEGSLKAEMKVIASQ